MAGLNAAREFRGIVSAWVRDFPDLDDTGCQQVLKSNQCGVGSGHFGSAR
jgi:hypothetical protein